MKKRRIAVAATFAVLALVVGLFFLLRSSIQPNMVAVTRCRVTPDGGGLECECRMRAPCEAVLMHHKYDPIPPQAAGRFLVERTVKRREQVGKFPCRYDWLRGEYVVTLRFDKGAEWSAEGAGRKVSCPVWSRKPTADAAWDPTAETLRFREGGGFDVLTLPAGDGMEALQLQISATGKPS
jgi:hypothetical protein